MEEMDLSAPHIRIDGERCISCRECLETCPQTREAPFPVYAWGEDGLPKVVNPESCIRCLSCELRCRARAITVDAAGGAGVRGRAGARAGMKWRGIF